MKRRRRSSETEKKYLPKGALSRIERLFNDPIDRKYIDSAISYLKHQTNKKQKKKPKAEHCINKDSYCSAKIPQQVLGRRVIIARARNTLFVSEQLRKALLLHDWDSAVKLVLLIIGKGTRKFTLLIIKTCLVILFCHPMATPELLSDYISTTTGYMIDSDIEDFVLLLFTIRRTVLPPRLYINKYSMEKLSLQKVTEDPLYTFSHPVDIKEDANSDVSS